MDQVGFVRKVEGDSMELEVRRMSGCGENCSNCSSSCDAPAHIITIENQLDAEVGDFVEIKGHSKNILMYTAIVYMIPLAFLIIGIAVGNSIFKSKGYSNYELLSFGTGMLSLAISLLIVKLIDKKMSVKKNSTLSITRIL
ncbi:MAG TPA: SoxR reducing system RseC family protein [Tissierellaceae bacterium]|nr:SoxR reducing system RseC family protein [Tissierellaceae bacterium]